MNCRHLGVVIGMAFAAAGYGQNVISAKAGLIQYAEGRVLLEGNPVEIKYSQFPQVKNDQVLKTEEGRAEVLLSHASFLRLGENSSFRMISDSLTDTRFEVLGGSALVEVAEIPKESQMNATFSGRTFSFRKNGLYRFDSAPAAFRVYDGEAVIGDGRQSMTVKKGHMVPLDSQVLTAQHFDPKDGDELYRWAARRDSFVSMASIASAQSMNNSGYGYSGYSGYGYSGFNGGWYFNPWYGMFTYVPMMGSLYSPFGYGFWSPGSVIYAVSPYYGNGAGGGGGNSGGGALYTGGKHYNPGIPANGIHAGARGTATSTSVHSGTISSGSSSSSPSVSSRGTSTSGGFGGARGASSGGGSTGGRGR